VNIFRGSIDLLGILRIDRAGQSEFRVVCHRQSVIKIFCFSHGEHRTKKFFLKTARLRADVRNHGRLNKMSVGAGTLAAGHQTSSLCALLDVT
jgi:hypothetical protein